MYMILANSGAFGVCSVFVSYFLSKYSIKTCLVVSSFGYCIFNLAGLNMVYCAETGDITSFKCHPLVSQSFVVLAAALSGSLAGLIWVSFTLFSLLTKSCIYLMFAVLKYLHTTSLFQLYGISLLSFFLSFF